MARVTVTVAHNDTATTIESEDVISPDLLDDMCRRASATLIATLVQLVAALAEDD